MPTVQVPPAVGTSGQFIDAVVITSSTLRQIVVLGDPATSGAISPVTSSFGVLTNFSSGGYLTRSLSSGTVTLSSAPTVTATAGTNPWSSAPGFNLPVVNVSSGLVQTLTSGPMTISGTVTVLSASSGLVQISGTPTVIVASSAGLTQTVTVVNTSSGLVQALTTGTLIVVNVSSGLVQLSGTARVLNTSSGVVGTIPSTGYPYNSYTLSVSSSASITTITTAASIVYGWAIGNQGAGQIGLQLYNSTGPTIGSTVNLTITVPIPGSNFNVLTLTQGRAFSGGLTFLIVENYASTSTALGAHNAGDLAGTIFFV